MGPINTERPTPSPRVAFDNLRARLLSERRPVPPELLDLLADLASSIGLPLEEPETIYSQEITVLLIRHRRGCPDVKVMPVRGGCQICGEAIQVKAP